MVYGVVLLAAFVAVFVGAAFMAQVRVSVARNLHVRMLERVRVSQTSQNPRVVHDICTRNSCGRFYELQWPILTSLHWDAFSTDFQKTRIWSI